MSDTAIVVLAAGASRRMQGRDKLMEDVDGMPLLRRSVMRALATGCDVWVTLPAAPHPRYTALSGLEVTVVAVPDAAEGMNASLRRGLQALPASADSAMILLADMPDLTTPDLQTILQVIDTSGETLIWRAITDTGEAGHPIVFHRQLWPDLMALGGDQGGGVVAKAHAQQTAYIPLPDCHARTDLDTPEAWAQWRAGAAPT